MKLRQRLFLCIVFGLITIMAAGCDEKSDNTNASTTGTDTKETGTGTDVGTDADTNDDDTADTDGNSTVSDDDDADSGDDDTDSGDDDTDSGDDDSDSGDDDTDTDNDDSNDSETDDDTIIETDCGTIDEETEFCDERDGTIYTKVTIGSQVWMAENLNYGTMVAGSEEQDDDSAAEKYCGKDDSEYCDYYGGLYQWAEAMGIDYSYNADSYSTDADQTGICPDGWHLPSESEWSTLRNYVSENGSETCPEDSYENTDNCIGYDLKSSEKNSWATHPGTEAGGPGSDLFDFNGLGGGGRYYSGYVSGAGDPDPDNYFGWLPSSADGKGFRGIFYSATESDDANAKVYHLGDDVNSLGSDPVSKSYGFSVRCVED